MLTTKLTVIALAVAAGLTAAYPASSVDYMTAPENEFVEARASAVDALADKVATKLAGLLQVQVRSCDEIIVGDSGTVDALAKVTVHGGDPLEQCGTPASDGGCDKIQGYCNGACATRTDCDACCDGTPPNANGGCGSVQLLQTKKTCPAGQSSCDGGAGCTGGLCGDICVHGECVDTSNKVNTGYSCIGC